MIQPSPLISILTHYIILYNFIHNFNYQLLFCLSICFLLFLIQYLFRPLQKRLFFHHLHIIGVDRGVCDFLLQWFWRNKILFDWSLRMVAPFIFTDHRDRLGVVKTLTARIAFATICRGVFGKRKTPGEIT